jgi:hypothetical protein
MSVNEVTQKILLMELGGRAPGVRFEQEMRYKGIGNK